MASSEKNMNMENKHPWFQLERTDCLELLDTSFHGLSEEEAAARRATYGRNELPVKETSPWTLLIRQFNNPLVFILLGAATVTGGLTVMGEDMLVDTIVIVAVVILNAILGFFQEGKAESALAALKKMLTTSCTVVRNGEEHVVDATELVPGDVVMLSAGDRIPADLRLLRIEDFRVNESALTGESLPVSKLVDPLTDDHAALADQTCMAFSGTFVAGGYARALVVATALDTEFGKIVDLMQHTETKLTPLQRKIGDFTSRLIQIILMVGVVNFILGALLGYRWIYSFLASVSLVVAAIPEMLPMIVTAILAFGATRMAHRHALIRRLPATETLGCTTVICSDKTGTLTRNEMTVTRVWSEHHLYSLSGNGYDVKGEISLGNSQINIDEHPHLATLLRVGTECNDAKLRESDGHQIVMGDPTEAALKVSAEKSGILSSGNRIGVVPFDSEKMFMATLDEMPDGRRYIHFKGAPEQVLEHCSTMFEGTDEIPLDKTEILDAAHQMATDSLRVLAMGCIEVDEGKEDLVLDDLQGLCFYGLQGMMDPPRPEAITAVEQCRQAGIRTVMITGDHLATAKAIASRMGIGTDDETGPIAGRDLVDMSDEQLKEAAERVSVYARVAPADKLRIAQSLQSNGHVVAMTGDGVNDAPALKAADIGIAMGINGTEVTKEAADMILVDDNFASIVGAVEEGRHAWNNLEKAILYTLPTNAGQALLVMGAVLLASFVPLFGISLPLEPVQILWINLFDSVFLTMPLMMEAKERDLLHSKPRSQDENLASPLLLQRCILIGLTIAACGFFVFYRFGAGAVVNGELVDEHLLRQAQTAAFWAVLLVHFGFVMSARSVYSSAFTFSPFTNRWLMAGIVISLLARLAPTFIPSISSLFRTVPFPVEWWLWIVPCLLPGFIVLELDKLLRRRSKSNDGNLAAAT